MYYSAFDQGYYAGYKAAREGQEQPPCPFLGGSWDSGQWHAGCKAAYLDSMR